VKIENIYIRYEDELTGKNVGSGKLVAGILLEEVSLLPAGADWKVQPLLVVQEIMHKIGKVKNFTFFLDFQDSFTTSLGYSEIEQVDLS